MLTLSLQNKIREAKQVIRIAERKNKKMAKNIKKKFFELTESDKRKIREILRETQNDVPRTAKICGVTKHAVNLTKEGAWK